MVGPKGIWSFGGRCRGRGGRSKRMGGARRAGEKVDREAHKSPRAAWISMSVDFLAGETEHVSAAFSNLSITYVHLLALSE